MPAVWNGYKLTITLISGRIILTCSRGLPPASIMRFVSKGSWTTLEKITMCKYLAFAVPNYPPLCFDPPAIFIGVVKETPRESVKLTFMPMTNIIVGKHHPMLIKISDPKVNPHLKSDEPVKSMTTLIGGALVAHTADDSVFILHPIND